MLISFTIVHYSQMNNNPHHLHVPNDPAFFSQRLPRPSSPHDPEEGLPHFSFSNTSTTAAATMPTIEEQLAAFQQLAATQQKQIEEANEFARQQQQQLADSRHQLQQSQQTVQDLTTAFQNMATTMETSQSQPTAAASRPHRKKPELPPFDPANIQIWIRRVRAAYDRAGIEDAKDKFAFLESMFQVKMNPRIDAFLYGSNTEQDWSDFMTYLVKEYGPTIRQKTVKLLSDNPRHDMTPTQYLIQLKEDCKDVEIDDIYREHLLKTIPPRIREILGKEVENMSSEEVATAADDYFDRKGRPLEKVSQPVNHVTNTSTPASTNSTPSFTPAFGEEDDETDINAVKKGNRGRFNNQGGNRQRSKSRNWRDKGGNQSSSSAAAPAAATTSKASTDSTCYFHRRWGDKTTKCVTNCSLYSKFIAQNRQAGNGQGGRRQ